MAICRLAYGTGHEKRIIPAVTINPKPAGLYSYYSFRKNLRKKLDEYQSDDWILDSGAFSAWSIGAKIDHEQYLSFIRDIQHCRGYSGAVTLDVIGSWEASRSNYSREVSSGVKTMPVFHIGDPWWLLEEYCQTADIVGLSCLFGEPKKESFRFYQKCFAMSWPHKFHSFGWMAREVLRVFPFHSADSSSWILGTTAYGRWNRICGHGRLRAHQVDNLRKEVEFYLELQHYTEGIWAKELRKIRG